VKQEPTEVRVSGTAGIPGVHAGEDVKPLAGELSAGADSVCVLAEMRRDEGETA